MYIARFSYAVLPIKSARRDRVHSSRNGGRQDFAAEGAITCSTHAHTGRPIGARENVAGRGSPHAVGCPRARRHVLVS
jgi:hypothetical protein